jgi:Pex19 protein family
VQDIGERYPQWLAKHASSLSDEELTRYTQQHQHIVEMCRLYDEDADNFTAIFSQLQKVCELHLRGLDDAVQAMCLPEGAH